MRECHGLEDVVQIAMSEGGKQRLQVRDGVGRVELSLSTSSYPAGMTPDQARFIAAQLLASAERVEKINQE